METVAVVFEAPGRVSLQRLPLASCGEDDVVVEIQWSGISTGTERLLYRGDMPPFPGMGYPLVPGYEATGTIVDAGAGSKGRVGDAVFVPGASCFGEIKGLFGGSASRLVVPAKRAVTIDSELGKSGTLLALAATAWHVIGDSAQRNDPLPELIVGHGVLGRLLARIVCCLGGKPTVWETNETRRQPNGERFAYDVVHPDEDQRRDYRYIVDMSGDATLVDTLVARLQKGGEIVLAGFYPGRVDFAFPLAFMKEARLRIAAEWQPTDLEAVLERVRSDLLSLEELITHEQPFEKATAAYRTAFDDPACLKMLIDWRTAS